ELRPHLPRLLEPRRLLVRPRLDLAVLLEELAQIRLARLGGDLRQEGGPGERPPRRRQLGARPPAGVPGGVGGFGDPGGGGRGRGGAAAAGGSLGTGCSAGGPSAG